MFYHIDTEERTVGEQQTERVYIFNHSTKAARAEIWPGIGFNCLRWQIGGPDDWQDLLYVDPNWDEKPVPTRSGVPILFPFPNRIANGRFECNGKTYQLPLNDSTQKNAIHGFTPRRP